MPDLYPEAPTAHRLAAITAITDAVGTLGGTVLTSSELKKYSWRGIAHGWRLPPVEIGGQARVLNVLADPGFPRTKCVIALADPPPFLTWPHVEKDGVLCLWNPAATVDPNMAVDTMNALLGEAVDLIEEAAAGKLEQDFRDEFLSYWDHAESPDARGVLSLLKPQGPTREIRVWRGRDFYLLAETDEELEHWLDGFSSSPRKHPYRFEPALLVWREAALIPSQYPKSGHDLKNLAGPDGLPVLDSMAANAPDKLVVALGAPTSNGVCLGATYLVSRAYQGGLVGPQPIPLDAGFRPGQAPPALLANRFYGSAKLMRSTIQRVDPSWVHGRDRDDRQVMLSSSTVTIIGCGSIGAAVAVLLAQAGVGRLRLIDYDVLTAANASRHPLGLKHIGRAKVKMLAEHLRERFPHLKVEYECASLERLRPDYDLYEPSDLIISAMGNWAAEGRLNADHLARERSVPILYGWTEPHAVAGHAVLVDHRSGCLQCGCDSRGAPFSRVTDWPSDVKLLQEPACGAVYQAYGATELSHVNAMIAELALAALLQTAGPAEHRIWVAGGEKLMDVGGQWSSAFSTDVPAPSEFGFQHRRQWLPHESCPECQAARAAA